MLPILRAYAEVARSPALYLYAWQFLHMQLLLDHSSDNVKSACIKYLKVIIPTGDPKTDKGKATLKALKSELLGVHYRRWAPSNPRVNKLDYEMVPLMAPKQFYKIVQLVFSPTHRQGERYSIRPCARGCRRSTPPPHTHTHVEQLQHLVLNGLLFW